jgi:PPOX class probable F420-dependent enzyme
MAQRFTRTVRQSHRRLTPRPTRVRPEFPKEWGVPREPSQWIRWSHVDSKLRRERVYWVSTARRDGKPHAAPVWGIWTDNSIFFETDPRSVKGRNLSRDPRIAVHLQDGSDTAIIEGRVRRVKDTAEFCRLQRAYELKYYYRPNWSGRRSDVVYRVEPQVIHAWRTPRMHRSMVNFVF